MPSSMQGSRARSDLVREREELQAEIEALQRHTEARKQAHRIWHEAKPATDDHPYLVSKGIGSHGLRLYHGGLTVAGFDCEGSLLAPLRDFAGQLHSLQFIGSDGTKRFLPGGRKSGLFYEVGHGRDSLIIAEGFATGASIHEATGHRVIVAFDSGNLLPVAKALRTGLSTIPMIIAADNDREQAHEHRH